MLIKYGVRGYKTFNKKVEINFIGNKKIKNKDNVFNINNDEIIKSMIIYGANNTGKTTIVESLSLLKSIIQSGKISSKEVTILDYNIFDWEKNKKEIEFDIEFLHRGVKYRYYLKFKNLDDQILIVDEEIFKNDKLVNNRENFKTELTNAMKLPDDTLFINISKYYECISSVFKNMTIIPNSIIYDNVVEAILSLEEKDLKLFAKIMKKADISLIDFNIRDTKNLEEHRKILRLYSTYQLYDHKVNIPSYFSDSSGTKIFMYYIATILKLKNTGGVLVVDEIDRSLHTLLSKYIISLFNDEDNNNIQLLATSHDLLLLDTNYLFRKDQVWFANKDENGVEFYSLNEFKSNIDKSARQDTIKAYLKGMYGALPHPDIEDIFNADE